MKRNLLFLLAIFSAFLICFNPTASFAVSIINGDVDGFGFIDPNSLYDSAQGSFPDTDGDGIIEAGEFLPDLNDDGAVNTIDTFDNRSIAESSSTLGAQWTDQSLVYQGSLPSFTFNFSVPTIGDPDYEVDHYINLIFGDYDVSPASIEVDGVTVPLTLQGTNQDGLVQLAYADVTWANMLDGVVTIDVNAPSEPYIAIDYAFLNTVAGAPPQPPTGVPEPSTILLLGFGIFGLLGSYTKRILK
jgi:hypothetical protein